MRGRTLNHAFVILDEAQNTTQEQMKMFLTRIGFGSKCVVTGDVSQIDLPKGVPSGLVEADAILQRVAGIGFTHFTAEDVVRHPLVARIVQAYDRASDRQAACRRRGQTLKPPLQLSLQFADAGTARAAAPPRGALDAGGAGRAGADHGAHRGCDEGRALNRDYRGKDYATNVLTFDYEHAARGRGRPGAVRARGGRRSACTGIDLQAHYAHLLVHGTLHAQGGTTKTPEEASCDGSTGKRHPAGPGSGRPLRAA
jgi:hypothetical protein